MLQKRAVRIICQADFRAHTNPLFYDNNILKVKDLYLLQLGQFMYKNTNDLLPNNFKTMYLKNRSFHQHSTRQSEEYHLPLLRTSFAKNTFIYDGPKLWNSFTDSLKNAPSLYTFKKRLKIFLFLKYKEN